MIRFSHTTDIVTNFRYKIELKEFPQKDWTAKDYECQTKINWPYDTTIEAVITFKNKELEDVAFSYEVQLLHYSESWFKLMAQVHIWIEEIKKDIGRERIG